MLLATLEDQIGSDMDAPTRFAIAFGLPIPTRTADEPAAPVVVNHGRWIARCPLCRGAEHASASDRRFLCGSCRNHDAAGFWLPTVWPDNADEIEEVLMARPDRRTRNWEPGETVDDLRSENAEHGVT